MKKEKVIDQVKKIIPPFARAYIRKKVPTVEYDLYQRLRDNPWADHTEKTFPNSPVTLGIIHEFYQYHQSYVAACEDLEISYKVLNISSPNWIEIILNSGCDAFLVWPSAGTTIWKQMYDDKLYIMERVLNLKIYPTWFETWIFENKRRTHEWLKANHLPHPRTWIFYTLTSALNFIEDTSLPIVLKSNTGASASGVFILRDRLSAKKMIKRCFSHGIVPRGFDPNDRQWGFVFLQEYLEDALEWRMIRIGDSYFGYRKEKVGDFHSGSHAWSWLDPSRDLLDLLKKTTDCGGFTSMDVDIFISKDNRLLINELQTVFGASTPVDMLRVDGKPGRYIWNDGQCSWDFETGDFSRNACSNARVEYVLQKLLHRTH